MGLYVKFIFLFSIMFFSSCSSKKQTENITNCVLYPDADSCSNLLPSNKNHLTIDIYGPATVVVPSKVDKFTLKGWCNAGAYPDNYIKWTLKQKKPEDDKESIVLVSKNALDDPICIDGKFTLNIDLSLIEGKKKPDTNYKIGYLIIGFDYNGNVGLSSTSFLPLHIK